MSGRDRYTPLVEWSDEDTCFIGSCPELFYGGCHGKDAKAVFAELCDLVEEIIHLYLRDGSGLPSPMSGRDFKNQMHRVA
jgi:predicted RNase H-like HicB family nuclease